MPRAHKGDRDMMVARMPRPVGDAVRQRARQQGVPLSDYIARVLAASVDMDHLAPPPPPRLDQELPMTG